MKRAIVGRTHTIVRLQTRIRRKDGKENFGGFVYVLDRFPQRGLGLWVFMCPTNNTIFCLYFVSILSLFPATTPRAITSLPYHHGLTRLCIHPGYHTRAITLHQYTYIGLSHPLLVIRTFVVLSFAGFYATCTSPPTPPPGATRYNLLHTGRVMYTY